MADPYHSAKGSRLTFKGGAVASLSKSIDKKKHKKKSSNNKDKDTSMPVDDGPEKREGDLATGQVGENLYTIDAAKKMSYEELFPVETKKFGYHDPKQKASNFKSVEDALDDRVKKKADRYCK